MATRVYSNVTQQGASCGIVAVGAICGFWYCMQKGITNPGEVDQCARFYVDRVYEFVKRHWEDGPLKKILDPDLLDLSSKYCEYEEARKSRYLKRKVRYDDWRTATFTEDIMELLKVFLGHKDVCITNEFDPYLWDWPREYRGLYIVNIKEHWYALANIVGDWYYVDAMSPNVGYMNKTIEGACRHVNNGYTVEYIGCEL